jgi:hypothetical protein
VALARGAALYVPAVQVYVLKKGMLRGYLELRDGRLDQDVIKTREISMEVPSVVSRAVDSGSLYLGPTPDTDASAAVIFAAGIGQSAGLVLVPVVLRKKTICLLVGHQLSLPVPSQIRHPLSDLAQQAAMALAAMIVRTKKQSTEMRPLQPAPDPVRRRAQSDEVAAKPTAQVTADANKSVISDIGAPIPGAAPRPEESARLIAGLLGEIEKGGEAAREAEQLLRTLGKPAVEALIARFPGRLHFNRFAPHSRIPPVGECSAVLRGLAAIGRPVLSSLAALLQHPDIEIRFYATYLISELIFPEAVALLARQLQDRDTDVRRIAVRVLSQFRSMAQFPLVVSELRKDLTHPEPRPRRGAVEALGALADTQAIPGLVELLRDPDASVVEAARGALIHLTKQDFGLSERDWLVWWERNIHRNRLAWLVDGLVHKSPEVRASSGAELEELTGQSYGYTFDLPRKEREQIRRRFLELIK